MQLFLLCLTIILIGGNISHLFFAASLVSEPRGAPQDDDLDRVLIAPFVGAAPLYNPSPAYFGKGLPADISQVAENNIIEGKNQGDPFIISNQNKCRYPSAPNRKKRDQPDYCQDVLSPLRSQPQPQQQQQQQQENGLPPIGTSNQPEKPKSPAEGSNYILPDKSNPDWAPPLKEFFETDPCQVRPWHVCAPYISGLDFKAWSSGRLTGFDLEGCNYCMYCLARLRGDKNTRNKNPVHCERTELLFRMGSGIF